MDEQYSAIKGQTLISLSVLIKLLLDVVIHAFNLGALFAMNNSKGRK